MESLIIRTGPRGKDYSGNFVVGHTHLLAKNQFLMRYEGTINESIVYYRGQQNQAQTESLLTRQAGGWYIGKLPESFIFKEYAIIPLVHLDLIFPQAGVQNLEDLERIVAEELGSRPTTEQPQ